MSVKLILSNEYPGSYVAIHSTKGVYISINHGCGSAQITLNKKEALEMIEAMMHVINKMEPAE